MRTVLREMKKLPYVVAALLVWAGYPLLTIAGQLICWPSAPTCAVFPEALLLVAAAAGVLGLVAVALGGCVVVVAAYTASRSRRPVVAFLAVSLALAMLGVVTGAVLVAASDLIGDPAAFVAWESAALLVVGMPVAAFPAWAVLAVLWLARNRKRRVDASGGG